MRIEVSSVSKRFGLHWVLKDLSLDFLSGASYAITGANGSGKSTLMKIISGGMTPDKGEVTWIHPDGRRTPPDPALIVYAAPYVDLIEDFSLEEMLRFHFSLRAFLPGIGLEDVIQEMKLDKERSKLIREFSSGLRQTIKLGLAFFSESAVIMLDEPTTNLDVHRKAWYRAQIEKHLGNRTILIASNDPAEYEFCGDKVFLGQ